MARSFNGTTDIINCGNGSSLNPAAITVLAWINQIGTAHAYNAIASRTSSGAGGDGDYVLYLSVNAIVVYMTAGAQAPFVDPGSVTITPGVWASVGFSYSSSAGLITYVNGAQADTGGGTVPFGGGNTQSFRIADDGFAARQFPGSIAEVAVWNTPLSLTEISAFNLGIRAWRIRPKSLIGYWPLDGIESPEPDLSGNKNNGTLTGTALVSGPPFTAFTPRWKAMDIPTAVLAGQQRLMM